MTDMKVEMQKQMDNMEKGKLDVPPENQSRKELKGDETKEEILDHLCLTDDVVAERFEEFGPNEIKHEEKTVLAMWVAQFTGTMPVMIEIALILTGILGDWIDFVIIAIMLIVNAVVGFHEEYKATKALSEVEGKLNDAERIQCWRKKDGKPAKVAIKSEEIVPGDVIVVFGGDVVPADGIWLCGDSLQVNECSLTGETRPRKIDMQEERQDMLKGSTVIQGTAFVEVTATGLNTEIGKAQAAMNEGGPDKSPLQKSLDLVVNVIVFITLVIVAVMLIVQLAARKEDVHTTLLALVSLVIAAVPVALPIVLNVTLAVGAQKLAQEGAIISHLSAMQDLSSMDVLCSDKTGTLTEAKMTIKFEKIWTSVKYGFKRSDVLELADMCISDEARDQNPIDIAITNAKEKLKKEGQPKFLDNYDCTQYYGFDAKVKRTSCWLKKKAECKDEDLPEKIHIAKGLTELVLDNNVPTDPGPDHWTVDDLEEISLAVHAADKVLGRDAYKTVAVAADMDGKGMKFVGLLPMKDPCRHDTAETIRKIRGRGIRVKMITGDQMNIAKSTGREIELGSVFMHTSELQQKSAQRDEAIEYADGFASVTPKDKLEIVAVHQSHGHVTGMCGDGVNDAPALSRANVGFAVEGALQAARNAADIVLTEVGLGTIFSAIEISRKIFERLQAYILYRIGSTIMIVIFLAILILGLNQIFNPLYVILLALINDITVLPIAKDYARGSLVPCEPDVVKMLILSTVLGCFIAGQTLIHYGLDIFDTDGDEQLQISVFLQMSISSQFLIFMCRNEDPFFLARMPHPLILCSTFVAQITLSFLCTWRTIFPSELGSLRVLYIWLYAFAGLLIVDLLKCETYVLYYNNGSRNKYYSWLADGIWYLLTCKCYHKKHRRAADRPPTGIIAPPVSLRSRAGYRSARVSIRRDNPNNLNAEQQRMIRRSVTQLRIPVSVAN